MMTSIESARAALSLLEKIKEAGCLDNAAEGALLSALEATCVLVGLLEEYVCDCPCCLGLPAEE